MCVFEVNNYDKSNLRKKNGSERRNIWIRYSTIRTLTVPTLLKNEIEINSTLEGVFYQSQ